MSERPERPTEHRITRPAPEGVLALAAVAGLSVLFIGVLAATRLLPGKYLAALCAALAALCAGIGALVWQGRSRKKFWGGAVLAGSAAAALLIGTGLALKGWLTLRNVTTPGTETISVGTFVAAENPAEGLTDLEGCLFGVLRETDRDSVDATLEQLRGLLGELRLAEYEDAAALTDALLAGEVDAIVCNTAYVELLTDPESGGNLAGAIREITRVSVETEAPPDKEPDGTPDTPPEDVSSTPQPQGADQVFIVYISGIDSRRSTLTDRSRSDVNILATVNPVTRQVLLVSTPRDYYVPLSISDGIPDKLTHAGTYGIQVCIDTLEMLYDIDIDYYFRLNFVGFEQIIDSLGGITVHSDYAFKGTFWDFYYEEGDNELNGEEALAFARERFAFPGGDRQRGKNQMEVIRAAADKLLSPEVLTNYVSLMDAVADNFETTIPYDLIAQLVRDQLSDGGGWDIVSYSVSGTDGEEIPYSLSVPNYVMYPDEETVATARDLMARMRAGEIVTVP